MKQTLINISWKAQEWLAVQQEDMSQSVSPTIAAKSDCIFKAKATGNHPALQNSFSWNELDPLPRLSKAEWCCRNAGERPSCIRTGCWSLSAHALPWHTSVIVEQHLYKYSHTSCCPLAPAALQAANWQRRFEQVTALGSEGGHDQYVYVLVFDLTFFWFGLLTEPNWGNKLANCLNEDII